jgi:molecular chaperone HscB
VNLQSDDFALFGLERRFAQDRAVLDARWKDLQRQAHPDKFAAQGAAALRIAMQWSVRINEAYQRLKDPLKRASYLCELNAAPIQAENNTAMSGDFLMQQMQWREDLDAANELKDIQQISLQCKQAVLELLQKIEHLLDVEQNFLVAAGQVRALMFMQRFVLDVDNRLDQFEL